MILRYNIQLMYLFPNLTYRRVETSYWSISEDDDIWFLMYTNGIYDYNDFTLGVL